MKKLSKGKKILIGIGAVIIILVLIISIGANVYITNLLQSKVESEVNQNSKIPYHLEIGNINIEIFTGSLKLKDITISPKQHTTDSLSSGGIKSLYNGHIDLIKVANVHIIEFLRKKELVINRFIIRGANFTGIKNKLAEDQESKPTDSTKVKKSIFSDKFKGLKIGKFMLEDANYAEFSFDKPGDTLFNFQSLSVSINDILFNAETYKNDIPVYLGGITVDVKQLSEKSMQFYEISTTGIDVNMIDTTIVINEFCFTPKYSRKEYNRRLKYENDLFSIKTKSIVLNGLGLSELLNFKKGLKLNSIVVQEPNVIIYRDKNLADPPYKYHPLLAGTIKKIPITFYLDSLLLKNASLVYAEKQKHTETPGEVSFKNLNIAVHNITNDALRLQENHNMPIDILAKLYGKGNLKARLDIDLTSNNESFNIKGNLGQMEATTFNKMTKELILVEITSGDIKGVMFNFSADDDVSNGEIIVRYENLKAKVLKEKDTTKKAKFMSFIAGGAIRSNNMPDDNKFRKGIINFERVKGKALPNYLWKSVLSGLISTIAPVGENKNQKEKSKAIKKEDKNDKKENKKNNRKKRNKKKG